VDDDGHGTHISGIGGAVGNNGVGMSAVNWDVSIMALKFIGPNGYGDGAGSVPSQGTSKTPTGKGVIAKGIAGSAEGVPRISIP
jgi:subtilisin family serine protease